MASWWDTTVFAWREQGRPSDLQWHEMGPKLGLDDHRQFWFEHRAKDCPQLEYHGGPIMYDEEDYEKLKAYLYPEHGIDVQLARMRELKEQHEKGGFIPSVNHQTPPDVPLERYHAYVRMLKEYGERAVKKR